MVLEPLADIFFVFFVTYNCADNALETCSRGVWEAHRQKVANKDFLSLIFKF